ncbi:putative polysaccharide biosynthesis protein [Alicyclobacillus acidiphilus]|uniref:putative polysaccharide biosynthesis protein n=1 Tax=Alicyclobacillus acidiphilus TaxID=182455 RepID=UPI001FE1DB86|nr:oligosaccharide flippase family protein [Alicyclobacillus acidiphilus]
MRKQSFLQGAMVLGAAGLATKGMAMMIQVVVARELGAQGFGLFQTINPLFYLLLTISTLALPPALSKVLAENIAIGNLAKARRAWRLSNGTVLVISAAVCLFALAFAPEIAAKWLDARATLPFIGALFRIPVVCLSSVMTGYYMGIQNQTPPAVAWIVETAVRTMTTIPLVIAFSPHGIQYGALAVMIGAGLGEAAGYLFMLSRYLARDRKAMEHAVQAASSSTQANASVQGTARDLVQIALPNTITNITGIVAFAAEPVIMYLAFAKIGIPKSQATALYGAFGMAMELLFLPTVLSSALSSVVIPAVSEAAALRNGALVTRRLNQVIQATMFLALPATVFFTLSGHDLATSLYNVKLAGDILAYVAPTCAFLYVLDPLSAVLQGLNKAAISTLISLVTSAIRIGCIYYFVGIEREGIYGVATAVAIAGIVSTVISVYFVRKYVHLWVNFLNVGKMLIAAALASVPIRETQVALHSLSPSLQVAVSGIVGLFTYLVAAIYLRVVRVEQLERIPVFGTVLVSVLAKMPFVSSHNTAR